MSKYKGCDLGQTSFPSGAVVPRGAPLQLREGALETVGMRQGALQSQGVQSGAPSQALAAPP